jgi:hypothetical protein
MLYKHQARFVPIGETVQSASDVKAVEVASNEIIPRQSELSDAKKELLNSIDSYSARNYWEIGDFVSKYSDSTKLSDTPQLRDFLINQDWAKKTEIKDRNYGRFIVAKHASRHSGNKILEDLKDYTSSSGIHMYADKQSMSTIRVYIEWNTRNI